MEKWLSFIVPVYNVEDYLSECVDSLLNQDVPSELYEIILYDDGSTDGSLRIAQKYGSGGYVVCHSDYECVHSAHQHLC